jgi:hypothetical protein
MLLTKYETGGADHGHDGDDGAVHGHGDGHLVERDPAEQDFHVFHGIDGNAWHKKYQAGLLKLFVPHPYCIKFNLKTTEKTFTE